MLTELLPPARPELCVIGGRRVLALIAANAEYGPALATRLAAVHVGVGPIEAAIATTQALLTLAARGERPDWVLSLGSAGSRTLEQTTVYQVSSVCWRDIDATDLGFAPGCTPFVDLPATLPLPCLVPALPSASLSTGAKVISGSAWDAIDEQLVDMETFAILRACMSFDVPLIGLRGVSDGAEELRHYGSWADCLPIVGDRLGEAVDRLGKALSGEP